MPPAQDKHKLTLAYGLNDRPRSLKDTFIYSLQWMMVMIYPVVWGYVIVGVGLGFSGAEFSGYMGRVVLMIGVSTLMQAACGHRFAMATGPNIIPSTAIMVAFSLGGRELAYEAMNAYIFAGLFVAGLGAAGVISLIGRVWTPIVQGCMTMMVGLYTSGLAMGMILGEKHSWWLYAGVFQALICGWLSIKGKGLLATIPVLVSVLFGYLVFIAAGDFDWELVNAMPLFCVPEVFPYGWEMPSISMIAAMCVVNIFAAVKNYGMISGYAGLLDKQLTPRDERRTFTIFGLIDGVTASLFGTPSTVSYGENMGILLLTRVAARIFIIIAAIGFIALSFFGKMGGMMAAMPPPVAGAVLLGVASTLIGIGAGIWHSNADRFGPREIFIAGFSVFFALGVFHAPKSFFASIPTLASMILGNPIITVIICSILLEQLIMRRSKEANQR
ncbi:MAG: purine/pyrimidine permease [Desulfovibrionaceae bacterium]|nr:purine/pyrimidine permease [Desulfovibrionaceae bacterium]